MLESPSPASRSGRRTLGPLGIALLLQGVVLLVAVFVVVAIPEQRSDPAFVARKKVYLPQRELEHKVALAEFQAAAAAPMSVDRIRTSSLLPRDLPSLPALPESSFNPVEPSPAALRSDAMLGRSGILGALRGVNTELSAASLFGIEDSGRRIVILFDNSTTVWNKAAASGVSGEAFVEELSDLIDGLNANTLFGMVPFARQVGSFRDFLVAAGASNKAAAKEWVAANLRSNRKSTGLEYGPDGIQGAFEVAFHLEPEVLFVISDADFQRNDRGGFGAGDVPWDDVEDSLRRLVREHGIEPRIHFIGFQVEPEAAGAMRRIVRRYGGEYRAFGDGD